MELLNLFEENFRPCAVVPMLGLSKEFILKNGFTIEDINCLIKDGKIQKYKEDGFRFTSQFMKEFAGCGINTLPEFVRNKFNL